MKRDSNKLTLIHRVNQSELDQIAFDTLKDEISLNIRYFPQIKEVSEEILTWLAYPSTGYSQKYLIAAKKLERMASAMHLNQQRNKSVYLNQLYIDMYTNILREIELTL